MIRTMLNGWWFLSIVHVETCYKISASKIYIQLGNNIP